MPRRKNAVAYNQSATRRNMYNFPIAAISFRGIWFNKHSLVCMFFMNSRSTAAATLSCKAGNKNSSLFWILVSLFPQFLGTVVAFENFLLFKAIVRGPSRVLLL